MTKVSNHQQQPLQQQPHHSQHQQYSQFNLPLPQVHSTNSHHSIHLLSQQQQQQNLNQSQPQGMTSSLSSITGQIMPHHPHQRSSATTQIIGTQFIDQSQYLTAIPVQPVLTASTTTFPASATMISPLLPPPDYVHSNVVLTPAQNQIQDHLQRKHEELQKLIVQQQDELRRVSEQLFMARYGLLPSIVNVSLPFVANLDSSETGESSRCISTSSHMSQQTYHEHHQQQQPQMIHHQANQTPTQNPNSLASMQHPIQPHQQQQNILQQQQMTFEINSTQQQKNQIEQQQQQQQSIDSDQANNEIIQFMHHQSQNVNQAAATTNIHQIQTNMQQHMIANDDFELIPFQMMNQQAQILFSSGNSNNNNNNNNSNSTVNINSNSANSK